jgi:PAS domain S-box-containing protein
MDQPPLNPQPATSVAPPASSLAARWAARLAPCCVLLLGAAITYAWVQNSRERDHNERVAQFESQTTRVATEAQRRLNQPLYGLLGLRAMFAALPQVSQQQFTAHVQSRNLPLEFPGVSGFAYIESPKGSGPAKAAYTVKYVAPLANMAVMSGLDLTADPASRRAVLQAIESGKPTLSERITVLQGMQQTAEFLFVVPLYQANPDNTDNTDTTDPTDNSAESADQRVLRQRGVIVAPVYSAAMLAGVAQATGTQLRMQLFDGPEAGQERQVFAHGVDSAPAPPRGGADSATRAPLLSAHRLQVGGRTLLMQLSSTAEFDSAHQRNTSSWVAAAGALLTLLAALCTWLLMAGRQRVESRARALTAELDFVARAARHTTSAVIFTDTTRRIQWVNDAFCAMTGYSREEAQGKHPADLFDLVGDQQNAARDAMLQDLADGKAHHTRLHSLTRPGRRYWADIEIQPLHNSANELTGFMQIEHDVTASTEAAQALAEERVRLDTLLITTNAGVLEWDLKTDEVVLNERCAEIVGHTAAELSPLTIDRWMTFAHPDDGHAVAEGLQAHLRGDTPWFVSEVRLKHKAGHWVWVLARARVATRNSMGMPTRMVGAHVDITEQKQALQRWRARAEMSGDWFWQTDTEHRFSQAVDGSEYHTQGLAKALLGKRRDEHEAFDPPDGGWAAFHAKLDRHEPFQGLIYRSRADAAGERWLEVDGRPRYSESGAFEGYEGVGRDITARRKATLELQASLSLVDTLFEAIPLPVVLKDTQCRYVRVNKAWCSLIGATPEQIVGKTTASLMDDAAAKRHTESDALVLSEGGQSSYEVQQRLPDGRILDLMSNKAALTNAEGKIMGLVATVVDVTDQRAAVRATVEAKEAADAANAAKSAFLATMSHEIRTPMNGVLGMAELLAHSSLDGEQAQLVHTVRESAMALLRIIDDILDFSKVEAGRMELEHLPLDVTPLVEGVCSALAPVARARGVLLSVHLDAEVTERVVGDAGRLRQVLNNLVGNAIKFSGCVDGADDAEAGSAPSRGRGPGPGRVAVRVSMQTSATDAQRYLRFAVLDNGIGMDEATQSKVFSPFTQAEVSTRRRFGGTGLGLAISRRLVELMGGQISLSSTPGQGSTFSVLLPLQATAEQPTVSALDLGGVRCCLMTEDGLPVADLLGWLEQAGAEVSLSDTVPAAPAAVVAAVGTPAAAVGTPRTPDTHSEPLVVIRAERDSDADAEFSAGNPEATADLRHLLIRHGRRSAARVVSPTAARLDLLCKGPFLRAVAMLAGRASPELDFSLAADADVLLGDSGEARVAPPSIEQARERGQLILVAEDDPINRAVILRQLALLGHAADMADDGAQALRMWRSGAYALLLSDLHMPQLDGYALAEAIRGAEQASAQPRHARLPILALTANALKGEAVRARAAGMDDYLTKPVPLKLLQAALNQWLPAPNSNFRHAAGVQSLAGSVEAPPKVSSTPVSSTPPSPETMPEHHALDRKGLAVLDLQQLRDLVGDDDSTVRELLQEFACSAQTHTDELRGALTHGHFADAAAVAHKLKSAARSVGALSLAQVCEDIESRSPAHRAIDGEAWADSYAQWLAQAWALTQAQVQHALSNELAGTIATSAQA